MKLATIRYQDNVCRNFKKTEISTVFREVDSRLPNDMIAFIEGYDTYKGVVEQKLDQGVGNLCGIRRGFPVSYSKTENLQRFYVL